VVYMWYAFCVCGVCVLFMVSVWCVCVMCSMCMWCGIVCVILCITGVHVMCGVYLCVQCVMFVCGMYPCMCMHTCIHIHVYGMCPCMVYSVWCVVCIHVWYIVCDVYVVYMWCLCVVCVSTCSPSGCPTQAHNKQHLSQVKLLRRPPGICTWFCTKLSGWTSLACS